MFARKEESVTEASHMTEIDQTIDADDVIEEDVIDVEDLETEPDAAQVDSSTDDDKLDTALDEDSDEDLLEGIPEEELKATMDVQLPKLSGKTKRGAARRRNADANVVMLTGDPVRMYLKEIG